MPRRVFPTADMQAASIHLLRHGDTEGGPRYCGRTDVALSDIGWRRMWASVEGVAPWRTIVSSPLARCAAFARQLSEQRDIPLSLDERLRELDFGEWEGRTAAELMVSASDALTRFWRDPLAHPPPGGETIQALQARVLAAWREIIGWREPALIISHGGPIRVILAHTSDRPLVNLHKITVPHAVLLPVELDVCAKESESLHP